MIQQKNYKFWFCTGSQDLYGDECLAHVAEHADVYKRQQQNFIFLLLPEKTVICARRYSVIAWNMMWYCWNKKLIRRHWKMY